MRLEQWSLAPFQRVQTATGAFDPTTSTLVCVDAPAGTRSIEFALNGGRYRVENEPPYTMSLGTKESAQPLKLPPGTHTIRATAYSAPQAQGAALESCQVIVVVPLGGDSVLYDEDFADFPALLRRYWVFIFGNPSVKHDHAEVRRRITRTQTGIRITCFAADGDYSGRGLNPRAELRLESLRLPLQKRYRATITIKSIAKSTFNMEFFQIMHFSQPIFQLDFHGGGYNARYLDVNKKEKYRQRIAPWRAGEGLETWTVEWFQDVSQKAFISVSLDGKVLWTRQAPNSTRPDGTSWLQYGVYKAGNNNQDMWLDVARFVVAEVKPGSSQSKK